MLDQRKLSEEEVNDRIQYWYSKWCNGVTRDEREIYFNLYKAYEELKDFWRNIYE